MDKSDKRNKIKVLEALAKKVLKLKQQRESRRPLLIEFCGSPKSGKTTTINSLNIFLKRNKFKTVVLTERASVCPISKKTHPFFNIWTMTSAIAEMVQHIDQGIGKVDIIIADRGIFDALCWFEWLNKNGHLDDEEYDVLAGFALMERWQDYLDLIYVFQVKPDISIAREYANLLTEKRGSIMEEATLEGFNKAIDSVVKKHGKKFRKVMTIDTAAGVTDNNPSEVGYQVTSTLLDVLKELLIEKIGYFDNAIKTNLNIGITPITTIEKVPLKFGNRDKVEASDSIQPISVAVVTNKKRDKVLVVKKSSQRTPTDSPESNKLLLYVGGHVRSEDEKDGKTTIETIKKALKRELHEEIGESLSIKDDDSFLIYTPESAKSKKHLAVCYVIEMNMDQNIFKLTSDELTQKKGTSESGQIFEINKITSGKYKLESWSRQILKKVFKTDISQKYFSIHKEKT